MHLSPEDQRHLEAAEGWLELGNHIEANKELDEIEPASRVDPDVLQVRWLVFAKAKNWIACHDIAEALIKIAPDRRFGWLHKAFSLDNLDRTAEARQTLLEAVERFEPNATLPYYLLHWLHHQCRLIPGNSSTRSRSSFPPGTEPATVKPTTSRPTIAFIGIARHCSRTNSHYQARSPAR